jgi:hypothetical protein
MSIWKTWSDEWDKIVVEKRLIRTWPRWTIHRRRPSRSLDIEEPYVMEKGKWMFNPRNQSYYEESYITKCESLFNHTVWNTSRSSVTILIKSKRDEVVRFNIVQAQVEGVDFIFNLEYRLPLYQEGYHMDYQQSLNAHIAYKPKWDEWNTMVSYSTHLVEPEKTRQSGFSNRSVRFFL